MTAISSKCPKCERFLSDRNPGGWYGCLSCGHAVVVDTRFDGALIAADTVTCPLNNGGVCVNAECKTCYCAPPAGIVFSWRDCLYVGDDKIATPSPLASHIVYVAGVPYDMLWRTIVHSTASVVHTVVPTCILRARDICSTARFALFTATGKTSRLAREIGARERCGRGPSNEPCKYIDCPICYHPHETALLRDGELSHLAGTIPDTHEMVFETALYLIDGEASFDEQTYVIKLVNDGVQDGVPVRFIALVPKDV